MKKNEKCGIKQNTKNEKNSPFKKLNVRVSTDSQTAFDSIEIRTVTLKKASLNTIYVISWSVIYEYEICSKYHNVVNKSLSCLWTA